MPSGFSLSFSVLARLIRECPLAFPTVSKVNETLKKFKRGMEVPMGGQRPALLSGQRSQVSLWVLKPWAPREQLGCHHRREG